MPSPERQLVAATPATDTDAKGTYVLSRTVRFEVSPAHAPSPSSNTHEANPCCEGVGAYFEATFQCLGTPHHHTGMVQDIHDIDALARTRLADELRRAITTQGQSPAQAVRAFARTLTTDDPTFASITLALNPRRSVTLRPSSMNDILLTHQYQFAASHRLYNASLSQAENEALFGKCCRESGHGHNYDVEVDVIAPIDGACTRVAMDKAVQKSVIDRFDHRNLNTDCAEFKTLLPTVEHITMVCHRLLREPIADVGGTLRQVRVWETQRTWASYPAEPMT